MNTTPTSSHPDVVDATHVLRGLVQLALRRVIQGPGSAEAVALLNDVERGAKSLFCTVDIKSVNAQLQVCAVEGGQFTPLLNFEIGLLGLLGDAAGAGGGPGH